MPPETLNVIIALLAFGLFHSVTAALGFKALMVALLGQRGYLGLYRLLYNILSVITLAPVFWLMGRDPGAAIWSVQGAGAMLLQVINGIGLLGVIISLLQIDLWRFAGVKQALAYVAGEPLPLPEEPLSFGGLYGLVRHPLYLFSLLWVWSQPTMSAAWLGFAIGATLYFALGSLVEEQKLVRQFGNTYVEYQKRVPWLIPFTKWR